MKAVPGYSHLHRRGAVYWLRKRVPNDLETALPFGEWKETLRTKELEEAKRRLRLRLVEIDREIEAARAKAGGPPPPPLTREEAQKIAHNRLAEWLQDDDAGRLLGGVDHIENVDAWLEACSDEERAALAFGEWRKALPSARWALDELGRWYPDDDPSTVLLAGELLKARVTFVDLIAQRQRGEVVYTPAPQVALVPGQPAPAEREGISLGGLIDAYRAERESEYGEESTGRKYNHIFKALEEALGRDRLITAITRGDCKGVRDTLRALPRHVGKRYPRMTLTEATAAAARDGAPLLAPNTVNSYLQNLGALFNWAVDNEMLEKNPARGLGGKGRPNVKRRGYDAAQLRTMFRALVRERERLPWRFWVPALALYSGARAGELCQLSASDVGEADGVAYFDFSEFDAESGERVEGRRLKTEASDRRVPVHPDLVASGFLDFVQGVREGGGGRLFPELGPGPNGGYSHELSRWFGRFMDAVGLPERALTFHSFRHGFRDACRWASIPEETAEALGGWVLAKQSQRYGDARMLKLLARESAKVAFEDFRLSEIVAGASEVGRSDRPCGGS